ncbi:MAG: DUF1887 family protein [Phocaeicola sp.]|nr:DUF1887 family protein [Phocaeicola sp.]
MRILISLLSDHIIPSYLYIKETEDEFDQMIFITTDHTEKMKIGIHLENTLTLTPESVRRVMVSNENYAEILAQLENAGFSNNDHYIVNETGGTKAMSIALFHFFSQRGAKFVYIPIGTNSYFTFDSKEEHPIKYRMNLKEYLSLYGLNYVCDNSLIYDEKFTRDKVFANLKEKHFFLLEDMRKAQQLPDGKEKRYWGGTWFEEYIYRRIVRERQLPEDCVGKSVKIYRKEVVLPNDNQNDNEIDVMYVENNKLYVIECKMTMTGDGKNIKHNVEGFLYKLAAIAKDLGLHVNSYLFTCHQMHRLSADSLENIHKRCHILGIKGIFSGKELSESKLRM